MADESRTRRRSGPRPKPASELRKKVIGIRVLPAEHQQLKKAARAAGLSLTKYVRMKLDLALDPK